jgi:hypothetical protein
LETKRDKKRVQAFLNDGFTLWRCMEMERIVIQKGKQLALAV